MKPQLRLALPPLASLTAATTIPFVLLDRNGRVARSGEMSPAQLSAIAPSGRAHAILQPGEAVVATIDLPPLPARRRHAAVLGQIEPMVLDDLEDLCVAHGPRDAQGRTPVAWVSRAPLMRAWQTLHDSGLKLDAIVPFELALPAGDPAPTTPLSLPASARWAAPLPEWSLARPEWRPARQSERWRRPLAWCGVAAAVWLVGLNLYALQLRSEEQSLMQRNERAVREAFPSIPVILDPLRQARGQRDLLREGQGMTQDDAFMPLAIDTARVLSFAAGHVAALRYHDARLTLELAHGYTPPADESALRQAAAVESLSLEKDAENPGVWRARRLSTTEERGR